jgi:peptidoglycan/xylan/chitin deacetylase (PgdA/CDA1 family)
MPFYHAVCGEQDLPHIKHLYHLRSKAQFEKDLDFLLKHYQPVSLEQLLDHKLHNVKLPEKAFFLSFDDGLREVFDIAAPVLQQKGIPATIFLNSAFVNNKGLFFRYKASFLIEQLQKKRVSKVVKKQFEIIFDKHLISGKNLEARLLKIDYPRKEVLDLLADLLEVSFFDFLAQQQPYLSSEQINQLIQKGFSIGAHSIDHPLFNQLDIKTQQIQIIESMRFVQQNFKVPYKVFSFPFTDYGLGAALFETIEKDQLADLTFGCAGLKNEQTPFHLQRFPMEGTNHPARELLTSTYIYYILKSLIGKNIIRRK